MSGRQRGQALVEAALVLPVLIVLSLGVVGLARIGDAVAGVEAATSAAAEAGARAPSAVEAAADAEAAFGAALAGYGLHDAAVAVDPGAFSRRGMVHAAGEARVDLSFLPVPGLPRLLLVRAQAQAPIQTWRTR